MEYTTNEAKSQSYRMLAPPRGLIH